MSSIDMLELAKKLIPDIEKGMPKQVAEAFSSGQITQIFRTAESVALAEAGKGLTTKARGSIIPGSTYFMDQYGSIARYGRESGWDGPRVSAGFAKDDLSRSPFLERSVFSKKIEEVALSDFDHKVVGANIGSGDYDYTPHLGRRLIEYDNDLSRIHGGHAITDIYHSSGAVEYVPEIGGASGSNFTIKPVNTTIDQLDFITHEGGSIVPSLKNGAELPDVAAVTAKVSSETATATKMAQGVSGEAPIMIHGSPVKGLARVEPFVPEIRKGIQGSASLDVSALVYGLDPDYGAKVGSTIEDQTKTLLSYSKPKTAYGTPDFSRPSSGSIYIGRPSAESSWIEAERMPPKVKQDIPIPEGRPVIRTPEVPVRVSSEGFDVLREITVDGKTEEQIAKEIREALEGIRNPSAATSGIDDLIEPSIARKIENPTREQYDAARARGETVVTEPYNPTEDVSAKNATKVETLASEYDTGAKSADLADGGVPGVGTREGRREAVVDSLLKDENHPDPAKAEFNRRWNEQVRKNSSAPTNKAAPFGGMSDSAIEADIYDEVKTAPTTEARDVASKTKRPTKPKPGSIIINADGTQTVVKAEPLNPVMKVDDLAKRATTAATGAATGGGSPAASGASASSTISGGGTARLPAAIGGSGPASAASRTAASITAPSAARSTRSLLDNALEVGQKLTRGHLGATALGVAAAGLLFGYANRDED